MPFGLFFRTFGAFFGFEDDAKIDIILTITNNIANKMTSKDRILQFIKEKGVIQAEFFNQIEASASNFKGVARQSELGGDKIAKILTLYPELSPDWLLLGKGEMLRHEQSPVVAQKERHLIPFYDVTAIGGRQYDADMTPATTAPEMIDTGDWFNDATAAMRVQGDSMSPEYKSGSIVALKQIVDKRVIMYGEDYVVETDEFRVIKRIQRSDNPQCLLACSTNSEQWESGPLKGRLIHEPFEIPKDAIRRMFLVLGEVRRNHSCNIVNVIK